MPHRIYIAVELSRTDGQGFAPETLVELLEEAMPAHVEAGDIAYSAMVMGVGTSVLDLKMSIHRRREALAAMREADGR